MTNQFAPGNAGGVAFSDASNTFGADISTSVPADGDQHSLQVIIAEPPSWLDTEGNILVAGIYVALLVAEGGTSFTTPGLYATISLVNVGSYGEPLINLDQAQNLSSVIAGVFSVSEADLPFALSLSVGMPTDATGTMEMSAAVVQLMVGAPGPGGGGGGIGQILSLRYNESDPFEVPCFGVPANYSPDSSFVLGAELTTGDGGIVGLLDGLGSAIPDGWTFPASIFVIDGDIVDILSFSAFTGEVSGGIIAWGESGGNPRITSFPGGIQTPNQVFANKGFVGPNAFASGNDSSALSDSGLAYSADQVVVSSTGADSLGLGASQKSFITGQCQTSIDTPNTLATCVGPTLLQLVDQNNNPSYSRTIRVHADVVARRVDTPGTDSAWQCDGVLRGDGVSAYSWVGGSPPTFVVIAQDSAAADWSVILLIESEYFLVGNVQGDETATLVNWTCTLTLDEVAG